MAKSKRLRGCYLTGVAALLMFSYEIRVKIQSYGWSLDGAEIVFDMSETVKVRQRGSARHGELEVSSGLGGCIKLML